MKLEFRLFYSFRTLVFVFIFVFLSGCAMTGRERATETTSSMRAVEKDYQQALVQIDATNASLEDLLSPQQDDLKKSFDVYSKNVSRMEKLGKQLAMHTEKMTTQGDDYLEEWENSYTNPEIQALSEQRRVEVREVYAKIPAASVGVKGALQSYLTDIKEIQMYLANDLTPRGIDAIRPVARKAVVDGDNLKETIRPVLSAFARIRAATAANE
ncbi:DUF2959 family protein [Geoalkalibacter subterraneus]|uniref:Lipoprotein n=1 Tax=Geoalkalibacter subterraneus TaxID=483547 RepID=A0A0B5FLG8_9BACT|nr:DUF2959 family protein [Geoalkalibacter subterraneus]AJF05489.1 hypothetical protein GSUB_01335 [Geoalkalibacter subterraneus]